MTHTLCVNGWAQPPDGLKIIAPDALHLDYRACRDFACTTGLVATVAPEVKRAIGWSLGGTLLMEAIARGGLCAKQLVLIAPPLQFVADARFTHGMDPLTFRLFHENYRTQPERTASRFTGLIAKGDTHARRIMGDLGQWEGSRDTAIWHSWLDTLNDHSFIHSNYSSFPPTLVLHGKNDSIVSIRQSEMLAAQWPQVTLRIWEGSGHAPHLHDTEGVRAAMEHHAREHGLA